jgi:hypothetical protein
MTTATAMEVKTHLLNKVAHPTMIAKALKESQYVTQRKKNVSPNQAEMMSQAALRMNAKKMQTAKTA